MISNKIFYNIRDIIIYTLILITFYISKKKCIHFLNLKLNFIIFLLKIKLFFISKYLKNLLILKSIYTLQLSSQEDLTHWKRLILYNNIYYKLRKKKLKKGRFLIVK